VGKTPLMKAAEEGDLRRVKALIGAGADVNAQQELYCRETALMFAVEKGHLGCVRALVTAGADLNAKNHVGKTALEIGRDKPAIAAFLKAVEVQPQAQRVKEPDAPSHRNEESEEILGGCRIVDKIGEGGFGAVYKAHHLALNIPVAVKVLISKTPGGNAPGEERFLREARIVARLKHANIVGVLNVGSEDGIHFIVMDFIEGSSLQVLLREKGRLAIPSAIGIFSQICQGLHYAHEQGVLHRDIKPGNILIETGGVSKIADFGLAKFADDDFSLTVSGAVMGSPYYLSPEQARDAKNVDRRSDIYSLGCTFYHAVCGQVPFQGETIAQVLLAHQQSPVPDPCSVNSAVPSRLGKIIMKMMAKKPEDRFESVGAVHRQLAEFVSEFGHRN